MGRNKLAKRDRLTIFVDQDNTLADLNSAIEERLSKWGYTYDHSRGTWDITEWIHGLSKAKAKEVVNRIFTDDGIWEGLQPIPGALSTVKKLHRMGHKIYVVTAPWFSHPTCMWEKTQWVRKHMRWLDLTRIILAHDKHLLRGDLIIDDKAEHVQDFVGRGILISYPYNQDAELGPGKERAKTWIEIEKIVERIVDEGQGS